MLHLLFPLFFVTLGYGLLYVDYVVLNPTFYNICINSIWFGTTWFVVHVLIKYGIGLLITKENRAKVPHLLIDLFATFLWFISFFSFLSIYYEYNFIGLWATSSVLIAVIGFALRGILLDLFSGIAMGLDRPFKIGDWIEMEDGTVGKVESINWRVTKIVMRDNVEKIIPNNLLASIAHNNYGSGRYFRETIDIELDYHISSHRAERILIGAASGIAEIKHAPKKPDTKISEFTNRGVKWELRFWLNQYEKRDELIYNVQKNLLRNLYVSGISVSKKKYDITYLKGEPTSERNDVEFLLRHSVFDSLTAQEIEKLSEKSIRRLYLQGETVINYGDDGDSLFLLLEGTLSVHIPKQHEPGEFIEVAEIISGEFFGEMSMLTGATRSATIYAEVDSIVYEVKRDHLRPILEARDEIIEGLHQCLLRRLEVNEQMLAKHETLQHNRDSDNFLSRIQQIFLQKLPNSSS